MYINMIKKLGRRRRRRRRRRRTSTVLFRVNVLLHPKIDPVFALRSQANRMFKYIYFRAYNIIIDIIEIDI